MRLPKASGWFQLALMAFSLFIFIASFKYNPRARLMPEILSALMFFLSGMLFLAENIPGAQKYMTFMSQKGFFTQQAPKDEEAEDSPVGNENIKLLRLILWLVAFTVALRYISYLITIPVWLLLAVKFEGKRSWRSAIGVAVGMGIFDWVLFDLLLRTTL